MQKRGISPLIATILIIGFTILLTALVMQWVTSLFKGTQEQSASISEEKTKCASISNLVVAILSQNPVKIRLDNNNDINIGGFVLRQYAGDSLLVEKREEPIDALGSKIIIFTSTNLTVTKIDLFPMIKLTDGRIAACDAKVTKDISH